MSVLLPFLPLISAIVPCPSTPPQKVQTDSVILKNVTLKYCLQCHLLCDFTFSRDYSALCEVLHFELFGMAEVNHMYAFFLHELR